MNETQAASGRKKGNKQKLTKKEKRLKVILQREKPKKKKITFKIIPERKKEENNERELKIIYKEWMKKKAGKIKKKERIW